MHRSTPSGRHPLLLPLLIGMLVIDFGFVVLHIIQIRVLAEPVPFLSLNHEFSLSENYQYFKFLFAAMLCGFLCLRRGAWVMGVWAVLFVVMALDDAYGMHEYLGKVLTREGYAFEFMGIKRVYIGEIMAFVIVEGILLLAALAGHFQASAQTRALLWRLYAGIGLLILAGVVIDALHVMPPLESLPGMTLLEDGGEMMATSLIFIMLLSARFKILEEQRQDEFEPATQPREALA